VGSQRRADASISNVRFRPVADISVHPRSLDLGAPISVSLIMSTYRIFYLRGGILDDADEIACDDLVTAAKKASAKNPELTAEIWSESKKVAVIRPCPPNARKQ
jgi:hypothetical protein